MKKLFIALFSFSIATALQADVIFERWFKASDRSGQIPWTVEFKNEGDPVFVQLFRGSVFSLLGESTAGLRLGGAKGSKQADHGYMRFAGQIDPTEEFEVWISSDAKKNESGEPDYRYVISKNPKRKTIFVTWRKSKKLEAQKGTGGKTQSGLDLKDNVTNKEIKKK